MNEEKEERRNAPLTERELEIRRKNEAPKRSVLEEIGNSVSHGLGAIFGIVALAIWGKGQFQFLNFFGYFIFAVVATLQVGVFSFALALLGRRKYTTLLSVLVAVVFYIFANIASGGSSLQFIEYFTPLAVSFADVVGSGFKVVNYYSFAIWFVVPAVLLFFGIKNYKNTDLI